MAKAWSRGEKGIKMDEWESLERSFGCRGGDEMEDISLEDRGRKE